MEIYVTMLRYNNGGGILRIIIYYQERMVKKKLEKRTKTKEEARQYFMHRILSENVAYNQKNKHATL